MADDPFALETEMIEIAEQIRNRQQKLEEQPLDMRENNQLQDELEELERERDQLNKRWGKALTEMQG